MCSRSSAVTTARRPFTSGGEVTISTGDYFDVFEVPVVRGRVFGERDDAGSTPVIVINRALAERWWPNGQDPIGQKIRIGGGHDEPEREVIGVVENVRQARLELVRQTMYVPFAQISGTWLKSLLPGDSFAWIVRSKTDPLGVAAAVRDEIQRSTAVPVTDVAAMKDIVADSIARQRANMLLMSVFGGVALLLAGVGVYGLVAYSVRERTREIGIRMALGARGERIVGMVLRQGLVLVVGRASSSWAHRPRSFLAAGSSPRCSTDVEPRNCSPSSRVFAVVLAVVAVASGRDPGLSREPRRPARGDCVTNSRARDRTRQPCVIQWRDFDSNGVNIRYVVAGEGEPVILLHGFIFSIGPAWIDGGLFDELTPGPTASSRWICAVTARAVSLTTRSRYGLEMVNDVLAPDGPLCASTKLILVGYSLGGTLALQVSGSQLPSAYGPCVLGGCRMDSRRRRRVSELDAARGNARARPSLEETLSSYFSRPNPDTRPPREIQDLVDRNDPAALAALARGMLEVTVAEDALKANRVPTLAICGEHDPIKATVLAMKDAMPTDSPCR